MNMNMNMNMNMMSGGEGGRLMRHAFNEAQVAAGVAKSWQLLGRYRSWSGGLGANGGRAECLLPRGERGRGAFKARSTSASSIEAVAPNTRSRRRSGGDREPDGYLE